MDFFFAVIGVCVATMFICATAIIVLITIKNFRDK